MNTIDNPNPTNAIGKNEESPNIEYAKCPIYMMHPNDPIQKVGLKTKIFY